MYLPFSSSPSRRPSPSATYTLSLLCLSVLSVMAVSKPIPSLCPEFCDPLPSPESHQVQEYVSYLDTMGLQTCLKLVMR